MKTSSDPRQIALEVTYEYTHPDWQLGPRLGRRTLFPLSRRKSAFTLVETSTELENIAQAAAAAGNPPFLWVEYPAPDAPSGTLVEIGDGTLLESWLAAQDQALDPAHPPLRFTPQQSEETFQLDNQAPAAPFGGLHAKIVGITVWVEFGGPLGIRHPYPIRSVAHATTVAIARMHFAQKATLMIQSAGATRFALTMVYQPLGAGAPGGQCSRLCSDNTIAGRDFANSNGCVCQ